VNITNAIFGISGNRLTQTEKEFFNKYNPLGVILFARNIKNREQLKQLILEIKSAITHKYLIIMIDQEGGRVARMKPPYWPKKPNALSLANNPIKLQQVTADIAQSLSQIGINCDTLPVLDVLTPATHDVIGDRAFGTCPNKVVECGTIQANTLLDNNILPVIKHIPGHGRAASDSHLELPKVDASLQELGQTDFIPFKALNNMPLAMTAHILYTKIDAKNPATQSSKMLDIMRNDIGFTGLIMTDDLSMQALTGSYAERTQKSLHADCDLILHCNGNINEMQEIADNCYHLTNKQLAKLEQFI